jgi:hypothetical protein
MKMYKTSNWSFDNLITGYEVLKRTLHTVTYLDENGTQWTERKDVYGRKWHNSFEEAREYLLLEASEKIERYQRNILEESEKIKKLKAL